VKLTVTPHLTNRHVMNAIDWAGVSVNLFFSDLMQDLRMMLTNLCFIGIQSIQNDFTKTRGPWKLAIQHISLIVLIHEIDSTRRIGRVFAAGRYVLKIEGWFSLVMVFFRTMVGTTVKRLY
jgi:hypothetical protein